jgi:hypothetical protein
MLDVSSSHTQIMLDVSSSHTQIMLDVIITYTDYVGCVIITYTDYGTTIQNFLDPAQHTSSIHMPVRYSNIPD